MKKIKKLLIDTIISVISLLPILFLGYLLGIKLLEKL
jgi:hypothetical protein